MRQYRSTGTYALILQNYARNQIRIGRLGDLHTNPGFYIYVGSAFGPGGVPAKTRHHRDVQQRPHWHIDFLRGECRLIEIWQTFDPVRREHQWAGVLANDPDFKIPMAKFGATDCQCLSHLFHSEIKPQISIFRNRIAELFPEHREIF